jgi:ABC-type cobalt transport system substrate-binding protein
VLVQRGSWRIVYLRRAKFSVWFSGEEAVENCVPEKGEILRLVFGCGSFIGACITGKLWRIVYLRRAKFSVWFSGVGPGWWLYNGKAVENCVPEMGEILRLVFGCGSFIGACTTGKLWRIVYLGRAKFSVWFAGVGTGWCSVQS